MDISSVSLNRLESNGEVFEIGSYHNISILIRKSDGYVNATKLCEQFKTKSDKPKRFRDIFENASWTEFYDEFCEEYQNILPATFPAGKKFIEDTANQYSKKLRGYYIHPKLINYVAMWASPKYAVYVSRIMDLLNERIKITNEDQTGLIRQLQDEINELKAQNEHQTNRIQDESIRVKNNERRLLILKLIDGRFKICAN